MVTLRGRGPTTYSLYETMELTSIHGSGALPIYVWSGIKWLPYRPLWDEFSTVVEWKPACNENIDSIVRVATDSLQLIDGKESAHDRKRRWIQENFQSYFGFEGMLQQIQWLLVDGPYDVEGGSRSSLHCEGKPDIERDVQHEVYCT